MERMFQIGAAILLGAAAVFFLLGNFDGVFISIVFACLSFFLSIRTQVKERLKIREEEGRGDHLVRGGEIEETDAPALADAEPEPQSFGSER